MLCILSIGGNALDKGMKNIKKALPAIRELSRRSRLIITHGNGPQVGELAEIENLSLSLLTAQTEAEIGYAIKKEVKNYLGREAVVVLTDVIVDKRDPAFKNPTKPIGRYYSKNEEARIRALAKKGLRFREFDKGFRRVVPSPKPIKILNIDMLEMALKDKIVIAGGGGGIPLVKEKGKVEFIEAVIDKDYTTALIANELHANRLFILTNVDGAYLNYGKSNEEMIGKMNADEAREYLKKGYFGEGSMKPKIEACIEFVEKSNGVAAIGNLNKALDVVRLKNCTVIA